MAKREKTAREQAFEEVKKAERVVERERRKLQGQQAMLALADKVLDEALTTWRATS